MGKGLKPFALAIDALVLSIILGAVIIATGTIQGASSIEAARNSPARPAENEGPDEGYTLGEGYVMVNTEDTVVYLRSGPAGEVMRRWPNGTTMTIAGGPKEVDGVAWKNVMDPEGNVGWVPARDCYHWLPGGWLTR